MNSRVLLGITLLLLPYVHLIGCDAPAPRNNADIVRVGVLPDESPEALGVRYGGFLSYLSEELSVDFDLKLSGDYAELLRSFGDGELDLVLFGGFTFVQAENKYGAEPLVMRDIDLKFTSSFVARKDAPGNSIADFRGRSFSFGSRLSTSGHLMPHYFLGEMNIDPGTFFREVSYSGTHEKTAYWVRDGLADLGAVNSNVLEHMLSDGRLAKDALRVVSVTTPYPNYTWAVHRQMDHELASRVRRAALALDIGNPVHAEILKAMGAGGFIPSLTKDFNSLREIARKLD